MSFIEQQHQQKLEQQVEELLGRAPIIVRKYIADYAEAWQRSEPSG